MRAFANHQRGFTFIELMVAVSILIILSGLTTNLIPAMNFRARLETENRFKELRNTFETAYREHAATVDSSPNAELNFGVMGRILPTNNQPNRPCTAAATTFAPIARYGSRAASDMAEDGYRRPLCLFINPRASTVIDGVTVYYHPVAIVSTGTNGRLDPGTRLDTNMGLILSGDDRGILIDGRRLMLERYRVTVENLRKSADALRVYFRTRYESDPARSTSIDYFGCGQTSCPTSSPAPRWDAGNGLPTTCWGPITMAGIHNVLGLSRADVTDGYGQTFWFDNCGSSVRSPNNPSSSMRTPPYTARVFTTLPGGEVLSTSVVGEF